MRTLALVVLTGCGVAAVGVDTEEAGGAGAELQAARCAPYPWQVTVGASQEQQARKELAGLAPAATMTWSQTRNTPAGINGLQLALECPDGKDALGAVLGFAAAHPALFRLEPSEWAQPPMPCASFGENGIWLSTTRLTYAGQPARADTFAFRIHRAKQFVVLEAVGGSWVPPAPFADALALRRCGSLDVKAAETTVRRTKLSYTTFEYCVAGKSYDYSAAAMDRFETDAAPAFEWTELQSSVELRKVHKARLVLDPSSWTPELLSSDANCPLSGGAPNVGFELDFDAVTGELLRQKPGVGCIVCLGR